MPNELQPPTGAAPLTAMLRQVALDVAEAQRALDAFAEAQSAANPEADLPAVAFCFPEVELDLQIGFSVTRAAGQQALAVIPSNPSSRGFFQTASFSSRLRARIAPRALLAAPPALEEPQ
jgi:hypothetical protein